MDICKDGVYIAFITPNSWMSLSDRNILIKELTQYQFHWLDIGSAKKKWFPKIGSSFTWYIIQKTPVYTNFGISRVYKSLEYTDTMNCILRDYIPLVYNRIIQNILAKVIDNNNEKYNIQTSSYLHKYTKREIIQKEQTNSFQYKLIHTPSQTVYSSKPHKYQDEWKVFISLTNTYKLFVDKCGMTQSIAFILCDNKENAEEISNKLSHDLFKFINDICSGVILIMFEFYNDFQM